jgi:transcriptional regulator with XRE-family HTH domain
MEPDHVGKRIARLRKAQGWSQRELARRAQIASPTLSYVERGVRAGARLTVRTLQRLAVVFNVSVDALLNREDSGVWWPPSGLCAYFTSR